MVARLFWDFTRALLGQLVGCLWFMVMGADGLDGC